MTTKEYIIKDIDTKKIKITHKNGDSEVLDHIFYLFNNFSRSNKFKYASTKTRAQVKGGGAKPYKQKGTGRARRGTKSSPLLVGGGVIFGPKKRFVRNKLNKKLLNTLPKSILSHVREKLVCVESSLKDLKTRTFFNFLKDNNLNETKTSFLILKNEEVLARVVSNIANIKIVYLNSINIHDVLTSEKVLVSGNALEELNKVG